VRYHEAREVEFHGRGVIDIGHFESEHIVLEALAQRLSEQIARRGLNVIVEVGACERSPFHAL
jgi:putative NIF3 family GTP cyclohydrolase 1 type 2